MTINLKKKDYSKELYDKVSEKFVFWFIPFDNMIVFNSQNKLEEGPNIIVANHPGVGRDIAGLIKLYDRQLFFTPEKTFFSEECMKSELGVYFQRHFGKAEKFIETITKPIVSIYLYK